LGDKSTTHPYSNSGEAEYTDYTINLSTSTASLSTSPNYSKPSPSEAIQNSPLTERVKIWSDFLDQTKLGVYQAPSDRAEAEYTVREIEKMMGGISYLYVGTDCSVIKHYGAVFDC
jgi:hypothetical protein